MSDPDLDFRIAVARLLNRGEVSAAPLKRLPLISIFDDEEYENYDLDYLAPSRRLRITAILTEAGFRLVSGRRLEAPETGAPIVFPSTGMLGTDPSRPAAELLAAGGMVVLVTPTQALLLYLHHFGDKPAQIAEELGRLVWEQPANLDKVQEWFRAAGRARAFATLYGKLERAQAEGVELRRQRSFTSRLPR